ncbi:MAG: ABC transporter permease [Actinomycetes bacterium]
MTSQNITARKSGFFHDLGTVALRALRLTARDPEAIGPALIIPLFFLVVNIGSLQSFVEGRFPTGFDFKAFQLPVAVVFAVTGVSRAGSLVTDIQDGYLDRLLLTPVRRATLLLGLMVADFTVVCIMTIPVVLLGLVLGITYETGILGMMLFVLIGGLWGLAFTGFPYAIALKTGNPTAVNNAFLLFFPFAFLTTAYVPKQALTGWLSTIATYNPTTYLLDALRSLISGGWNITLLAKGFCAIAIIGGVSFSLAFAALRGRVSRNS